MSLARFNALGGGALGLTKTEVKSLWQSSEDRRTATEQSAYGLVRRLYPGATWGAQQFRSGGEDYTLPGGEPLEAKATAVGYHAEFQPAQVELLTKRGSRLLVVVYLRQALWPCSAGRKSINAECLEIAEQSSVAFWAQRVTRVISAVIDVPGPWASALIERDGRSSRDTRVLKTDDFVREVARAKPRVFLLPRVDWRVAVTFGQSPVEARQRRAALTLYVISPSKHMDLRSDGDRQKNRCAPLEPCIEDSAQLSAKSRKRAEKNLRGKREEIPF